MKNVNENPFYFPKQIIEVSSVFALIRKKKCLSIIEQTRQVNQPRIQRYITINFIRKRKAGGTQTLAKPYFIELNYELAKPYRIKTDS